MISGIFSFSSSSTVETDHEMKQINIWVGMDN